MDGTSLNGSIYGIFYYGDLGIPAETTFSMQTPIESDSYMTTYPAFVSGLSSPAVYLNTTGRYIEWRLPATVNPQDIYFTNTPTHRMIATQIDCGQHANWPDCVANWFNDSPASKLVLSIFGSWLGFVGFLILVVAFVFAVSKKGFREAIKERLPKV